MRPHLLLSFLATLCAGLLVHGSDPLDIWHSREPDVTANQLYGVTWGGDRYVAVGQLGTALVSFDGQHWLPADTGSRGELRAVAFGGRLFLAVGDAGEMLTSPDGFAWTSRWSGTFANLKAAAWGNGTWVSVGENSVILTSPDAAIWSLSGWGGDDLRDVTWGARGFLAVGGSIANNPNSIAKSSLAAASIDGLHWTPIHPVGGSITAFTATAFGAGLYVIATTEGLILNSNDLQHWQRFHQDQYYPISRIGYGPLGFTAVSGNQYGYSSMFLNSSDGLAWESREFQGVQSQAFTGIAAGPRGIVLAGGDYYLSFGRLIHSPDLRAWSSGLGIAKLGWTVGFAGDFFFAPVYANYPGNLGSTFWRSHEGVAWEVIPGVGKGSFGLPIFAHGIYLAAGDAGQIAVAEDAATWELVTTGTTNRLSEIAYGNGRYVAVGVAGTIVTSTDGRKWEPIMFPGDLVTSDYNLLQLRWFNGRWKVYGTLSPSDVTSGHLRLESEDGISWQVSPVLDWAAEDISIPQAWQGQQVRLHQHELQVADALGDWSVWSTNAPDSAVGLVSDGATLAVYILAGWNTEGGLYTSRDGKSWERRNLPVPLSNSFEGFLTFNGPIFGQSTAWIKSAASGWLQSDPLVPTAPALVGDVQTVSGDPETRAVLRVRATGTSPLRFQWRHQGADISGATNQYLLLDSAAGTNPAFTVIVSNGLGSVESTPVAVVAPTPATLGFPSQLEGMIAVQGTPGRRYQLEYSGSLGTDAHWYFFNEVECESERPVFVAPSVPFGDYPAGGGFFIRATLTP